MANPSAYLRLVTVFISHSSLKFHKTGKAAPTLRPCTLRVRLLLEPPQIHCAGVAAVDIPLGIRGDRFERSQFGRLRNVGRHLAILGAADPDALAEARIGLL